MDVMRCDECGVEAPRYFDYNHQKAWWKLQRHSYEETFHLCSWACVLRLTNKYPERAPVSVTTHELMALDAARSRPKAPTKKRKRAP